jgi:RNA polymerase sigma factor (sigma-70 family)
MAEQESDAILIERFVNRREESAFVALVKRHGPLVEGICRHVLRNEHDVEDVFQATFFVLARKASIIAWQESMGGWLCAVAHRLAMSARADASRQQGRETSITVLTRGEAAQDGCRLPEEYHPLADPIADIERRDLRQLLDDELLHLPEKYRAPVVLCYLEGRTHAEAARRLGWPAGSMSRRLERARVLLRRRLAERGVSLVIGLFGLALCLYGAWSINRRDDQAFVSVRQAMSTFRPFSKDAQDIDDILTNWFRDESSLEREPIISLAELAALVAAQIEGHDPGEKPDDWRKYTVEMGVSALQLAQDARRDDRSAMLASVRRLDAICHKCHEVFRRRPIVNSTKSAFSEGYPSQRRWIFLATHAFASSDAAVRERFPTRNRIGSYAVDPAVDPIGESLGSTDG